MISTHVLPKDKSTYNVLIVEDSPEDQYKLNRLLKGKPFIKNILISETLEEAEKELIDPSIDIIFLDYNLPDGPATELLDRLKKREIYTPLGIVALTGLGSESIAVSLMKAGAHEYLIKDNITGENLETAFFHAYKQAALRSQLKYLASYDKLTGAANRHVFHDRVEQEMLRSKRHETHFAVILLDIDHFKIINDNMGHDIGDYLLTYISKTLKKSIRASDMLCRWGGDEFVILLEDITPYNLEQVLAKIQLLSHTPVGIKDHVISFSFSMGAAFYPDDASTVEELMKAADLALYQSKSQGRHQYNCYSQNMVTELEKAHAISKDIISAIKNKEFYLVFQPIVDMATGKVKALEALCRWQHPKIGLIMPNDFIELLEVSPVLDEFHHWLITNACLNLVAWNKKNDQDAHVSINLPAKALNEKTVRMLIDLTQKYDVPPSSLWLEITERQLVTQYPHAIGSLLALSEYGFLIVIDDFGTGHSSLQQLAELPIKGVKLDRSFMSEILENPKHQAITKATFGLCHELQIMVVVEGIESDLQRDLLRQYGYNFAQGYYFSEPVLLENLVNQQNLG